jgi:N-acetyl-gamma-glutamyl-phosphate reductase
MPEIVAGLERFSGREIQLTFIPHLAPLRRGIFASVVLRATNPGKTELLQIYRQAYSRSPFVRVVDAREALPETRDVAGTNFCDLAPLTDVRAGTFVVLGVLDNLVKGAAGQAVQVMNGVFRLPATMGLLSPTQGEGQGVHLEPVG